MTADRSGLVHVYSREGESRRDFQVGDGIRAMRWNPGGNTIATGGVENDLKLWDLNVCEDKPIFVAKNVRFPIE